MIHAIETAHEALCDVSSNFRNAMALSGVIERNQDEIELQGNSLRELLVHLECVRSATETAIQAARETLAAIGE